MQFEVVDEELAPFLACLCMGVLHAIGTRAVPAEVGIWSLGPTWAVRLEGKIPEGIRDVIYQTDELDVLEGLGTPEELAAVCTDLIAQLRSELLKIEDPTWRMWMVQGGERVPYPWSGVSHAEEEE